MNQVPWLATIASTLAWAAFDSIRKGLSLRFDVAALSFWISLVQIPGYLVWASFEGNWGVSPEYFRPALLSVALNLAANLAFFEAMRIAELSVAIPMLSFTPVFVAILGGPLLGEHLVLQQWLGIGAITFGALLLSSQSKAVVDPASPDAETLGDSLAVQLPAASRGGKSVFSWVRAFVGQRGVRLMLWVALFWALTPVADKVALRHAGVGVHGMVLSGGVAFGMGFYLTARGQWGQAKIPKKMGPLLVLGGVTNVVALGLQFIAIGAMVVSFFEAFKRALGLGLALASGKIFFGESLSPRKIVAGLIMALGVVLVLVS